MRNLLKFAVLIAGFRIGFGAVDVAAQDFGVRDPVTTPQSQTPALKGWIYVLYAKDVPLAQRTVRWDLVLETSEEKNKVVGAGNPHVKKKGDYGIRFHRGTVVKYVDFTLVPKNQVTVVVTK